MERGWIGGEWGGLVVSWRVGLGDGEGLPVGG